MIKKQNIFVRSNALSSIAMMALIFSIAYPQITIAQNVVNTPPLPDKYQIDINNIGLGSGMALMSGNSVSIGPKNGGLYFTAIWSGQNTGANSTIYWAHNWCYYVKHDSIAQTWTVVVGDKKHVFYYSSASSPFVTTPVNNDGTNFTGTMSSYQFTDKDGSIVNFTVPNPSQPKFVDIYYLPNLFPVVAIGTSITRPDGEVDTITYATVILVGYGRPGARVPVPRIQSVTNNRGFQLKFNYSAPLSCTLSPFKCDGLFPTNVSAINNAVDYCDPTADSCVGLTQNWHTLSAVPNLALPTTVTDALGRNTVYSYNASGNLSAIQTPGHSTANVSFLYDANNRVSSVTNNGVTKNYNFTLSGTIMTAVTTDSFGHASTVITDQNVGLPTSVTDENGHRTSYIYDAGGRVLSAFFPEGNYTQFSYDARGNVTQTTAVAKFGSGLSNITMNTNFDATCLSAAKCNKPNWTRDALGNQTDYVYDPISGFLKSVTGPVGSNGIRPQVRYTLGSQQAYFKNSSGATAPSGQSITLVTQASVCRTTSSCVGASDETRTTTTYGTAGAANNLLPSQKTIASGDGSQSASTSQSYDIYGNTVSITDANGNVTHVIYDADREITQSISPDPDGSGPLHNRSALYSYGSNGLVSSASVGTSNSDGTGFVALASVNTVYDANDREIRASRLVGGLTTALTQYSYDSLGRVTCTAQRMNYAAFASAPTNACSLGVVGSFGNDQITLTNYDSASRIISAVTGYGDTSQRTLATYTYNPNGTVHSITDGNNNLTTSIYDGFDRIYQTQFSSPTTAGTSNTSDYLQNNFDAYGRLSSVRLRDGATISYTYDALGRITTKTRPSPESAVSFAYDNLGHVLTAAQTGQTLTNVYDAFGRLKSEGQAFGTMTYQYDLSGNLTRLVWPDGLYVSYDHNALNEVTIVRENGATTGIGVLASYSYDDWGRITSIARGNGIRTSYSYGGDGRLSGISHPIQNAALNYSYSNYSPVGQIGSRSRDNDAYAWTGAYNVSRPYTANGLNQYTTAGALALAYDTRGNLITSGTNTYSYTSENMMKAGPIGTANLFYDPNNRLSEYDTNVSTRFLYSGVQIASELNNVGGSNTLARRYVYGPGSDVPLVWYEGIGTTDRRWLATDERGSVVGVTNSSGALIGANSYDDYGIPATANLGRFGFTGQAWFPEIGLYDYKARMYSPTLGRFMQTDPQGYADGPNGYSYAHNDPVNHRDPSGKAGEDIVVIAVLGGPENPIADVAAVVVDVVSALFSLGIFGDAAIAPPPPPPPTHSAMPPTPDDNTIVVTATRSGVIQISSALKIASLGAINFVSDDSLALQQIAQCKKSPFSNILNNGAYKSQLSNALARSAAESSIDLPPFHPEYGFYGSLSSFWGMGGSWTSGLITDHLQQGISNPSSPFTWDFTGSSGRYFSHIHPIPSGRGLSGADMSTANAQGVNMIAHDVGRGEDYCYAPQ